MLSRHFTFKSAEMSKFKKKSTKFQLEEDRKRVLLNISYLNGHTLGFYLEQT